MNNVNVTVNVNEITMDINEADEILEDLQALTSLLFALADSADGGSAIGSECLIHLGKLSRD